jgi:hypothetical protein
VKELCPSAKYWCRVYSGRSSQTFAALWLRVLALLWKHVRSHTSRLLPLMTRRALLRPPKTRSDFLKGAGRWSFFPLPSLQRMYFATYSLDFRAAAVEL